MLVHLFNVVFGVTVGIVKFINRSTYHVLRFYATLPFVFVSGISGRRTLISCKIEFLSRTHRNVMFRCFILFTGSGNSIFSVAFLNSLNSS